MEMKVDLAKLRDKGIRLFITSPTYGGQCHTTYMKSMMGLSHILTKYNIPHDSWFLSNESLIQRGRNYCAHMFMENSEATHMLFVDSDIEFNPNDVIMMLNAAVESEENGEDVDVYAGAYPKKCITWEKIKTAVDKGYADKDPNLLDDFVGDMVLNFDKNITFNYNDIKVPIAELGTGFMLISRKGLEKFKKAYPQYLYTPDHSRSKEFSGDKKVVQYFHTEIDEKSNRYLSEDYWFCRKMKACGANIYLAPWVYLKHTGSYTFAGKLAALSAVSGLTSDSSTPKK